MTGVVEEKRGSLIHQQQTPSVVLDLNKRIASEVRIERKQYDEGLRTPHDEEGRKGERRMPWRQEPKKDVVHCEKRRRAVCRR